MAWTTPPTFVTSNPNSAAQLNILSDDLEFLQGIADAPNAPFQSLVVTADVDTTYHIRYEGDVYFHYKYIISGSNGDAVDITLNGSNIYSDGVSSTGTYAGYVDITSLGLTAGTWYPIVFEWNGNPGSTCTVWYLLLANSTTLT